MVRLEFQENTEMVTVPTNNIFDQKLFGKKNLQNSPQ